MTVKKKKNLYILKDVKEKKVEKCLQYLVEDKKNRLNRDQNGRKIQSKVVSEPRNTNIWGQMILCWGKGSYPVHL